MDEIVECSFNSNKPSNKRPAVNNKDGTKRRRIKNTNYVVEDCKHPIVYKGLCGNCGADVYEKFEDRDILEHGVDKQFAQGVRVTKEYNEELSKRDVDLLLKSKKLVLLLDLDETLVHTCNRVPDKDEFCEDIIRYQIGETMYFTKIRPYALEFLRICNDMFEMHIASYGQRIYTHTLTQALDPANTIFDDRVLSRDELKSSVHKTKNLTDLFPLADRFLIMVDDRADVWEYSDAHIMIRPFKYFRGVGDINSPAARMGEISTTEKEPVVANDAKEEESDINTLCTAKTEEGKENEEEEVGKVYSDPDEAKKEDKEDASDTADAKKPAEEKTEKSSEEPSSVTDQQTASENPQPSMSSLAAINYYGYDIEKIMLMPLARSGFPGVSRRHNVFKKVIPTGNDGTLLRMAKILQGIHDEFYDAYAKSLENKEPFELDVKTVMANKRKQVLKDEVVVLSGICELGKDPTNHWLFWELEKFGAVGQTEINEETTVVVAAANNTEKVNAARARSIPVVTTVWLLECIYDWEKHDKELFTFEKSPPIPPHVYVYGNRDKS